MFMTIVSDHGHNRPFEAVSQACGRPWRVIGSARFSNEFGNRSNIMPVDRATVQKIAALARIDVPEAELDKLAAELSNILGWVEQLGEVDTEGVAPMASVIEMTLRRRADEVTDGGIRDDVLANAPDARDGFFAVPKVIE